MHNEYVFFDETLRDQFMAFAARLGVPGDIHRDPIEGWIVALPEEIDDETLDTIENEYDTMLAEQRALIDAADGDAARCLMGVHLTLPNGEPCLVRLPADYGRRLMEQFTTEELSDLVSIIARGVLEPVGGPICRKD